MVTQAHVPAAAMLVIHHDAGALRRLQRILKRRFGADYGIVTGRSSSEAQASVQALRDTGVDVALVLAEHWLPDSAGAELLAQGGPEPAPTAVQR